MIELKVNDNVKVCISEPNELLELMTGEDKLQLIESLSCHDEVIEHVIDQVTHLYGVTENGNSGWSSGVIGSCVLDKARNKIAESASELSLDTITNLKDIIKKKEELIARLQSELYKITL